VRIGPATKSMEQMLKEGMKEKFDLIFIDADKENYDSYYEYALQLVRKNGVIAVDNVFWHGAVLNPNDQSVDTKSIRALNDKISQDSRVRITLLPLADGIFLCKKL